MADVDRDAEDVTASGTTSSGRSEPLTLLGVFERVLAATAVAGATIYVLLNALYVEFLDVFGLRPEDVGLDRLAVLGRAAWIALLGLGFVVILAAVTIVVLRAKTLTFKRSTVQQWSAVGTIVLIAALLVGFLALRDEVEDSAASAKKGERVGGLGWIVEFVDVRALPARVVWVGEQPKPSLLTDEDYLYLGRGDQVVALLTCDGITIMFRPDDVVVHVLDYDSDEADSKSIC
jgi:hypothetical protein